MEQLYINIRKFREMRGMSQQELADKAGYNDRSSIAKIESGKVDLPKSKISDFARALNVSEQKLLGYTFSIEMEKEIENYENWLEKYGPPDEYYENMAKDFVFDLDEDKALLINMVKNSDNDTVKRILEYAQFIAQKRGD